MTTQVLEELVVGYYIKVVYCGIVILIYGKFMATSFTGFVIVLESDLFIYLYIYTK